MATGPLTEPHIPTPQDAEGIALAEELSEIAERAQSFTSAGGVLIALKRGGNQLIVRTSDGIAPEVGACIPFPSGVTGLCVTTGKPQTSASADVEAQLESVFRAAGVRSALSVPLRLDGDVHGVVAVLSQLPDAFSRQHAAILLTMSDVIAGKLRRSELPLDLPRQAPVPAQVVEIDVHSLFRSAPEPARVPKSVSRPPSAKLAPAAAARVEPVIETKVPSAMPAPAAKPLSELLKEPPAVAMDPDVLHPSEDPHRYSSVLPPKADFAAAPVMRASMPTADASLAMFSAYRAAAKSRHEKFLRWSGITAIVLLTSAGAAMYIRREAPAPAAAANPVAAVLPATPAPSPVSTPAPSKSVAEQPAPAVQPPAAPERAARDIAKPKPEAAKPAAVELEQQAAPIVHLPGHPVSARAEDAIAPPTLGLASNKPMPNLPVIPASVAIHKSVLVSPILLQGRPPIYPAEARLRGVSGVVQLEVSISAEGKVTEVRVISGDMFLRQAAVAAVREWQYRPGNLDGKPVPSTTEVSVKFTGK